MAIEREIKFKIKNVQNPRRRLKEIGAKKIRRYHEYNLALDRKGELDKTKALLRLRKIGKKTILGYKRRIPARKYKQEEEIEIEVSDFDKIKKLFKRLGFKKSFIYEKIREEWRYKGAELAFDKLPFGTYLEIEGKENEIKDVACRLGLDIKHGSTLTYKQLYNRYCKEKGIKAKDIVFKKLIK